MSWSACFETKEDHGAGHNNETIWKKHKLKACGEVVWEDSKM